MKLLDFFYLAVLSLQLSRILYRLWKFKTQVQPTKKRPFGSFILVKAERQGLAALIRKRGGLNPNEAASLLFYRHLPL
jgi:hypothetical protein